MTGRIDPATDPRHSFLAWMRQYEGKDRSKEAKDAPDEVRKILAETTAESRSAEQTAKLREHFLVPRLRRHPSGIRAGARRAGADPA